MGSSLARYDGKLVCVANLRVASEKAHVLQSFKMCEAFRRLGFDVELTYPAHISPPAKHRCDGRCGRAELLRRGVSLPVLERLGRR